jgi:hypothetical protein
MHTQHLKDDGSPVYINRLVKENSPYLMQHAHNPVDWYPWGEEAFAKAKAENKPIFLSIGYSTCHWCHVMARESFDDEHIAAILNLYFVSIKVDREQNPDIDEIYMTGVQLISGRGGWPMSSFLTPEGQPFFGGTYYPAQEFTQLIKQVHLAWLNNAIGLRQDAAKISEEINHLLAASEQALLDKTVMESALNTALSSYEKEAGGFGAAPKFPLESLLLFLLDQWQRRENTALLPVVKHTLTAMARGGIYDQVGGGFHRYSTDDKWLVPHFEKMLYNQALLVRVYSQAYQLDGDPFFASISRETLDYVLRDMRDKNGCFYSATDADSEGEEGVFFIWTPAQLISALGEKDAQWLMQLYGVTAEGNFEGANILYLPQSYAQFARVTQEQEEVICARLMPLKQKLYQAREQRVHPLRDEKIITAWNAMMITALAESAQRLNGDADRDSSVYLEAAENCAEYLYQHHWDADKKLLWRIGWQGNVSIAALQEDYACLAEALVALFDASGKRQWLDRAELITQQMIDSFWDETLGGFYSSPQQTEVATIVRAKSSSDGATPSGNSVALQVLAQLSARTGNFAWQKYYTGTLAVMAAGINRYPLSSVYALRAVSNKESGEAGQKIYMAEGNVVATIKRVAAENSFVLTLDIAEGWHINAAQVLQKELVAAAITSADNNWEIEAVDFPPAQHKVLGFQEQALAVYEDRIDVLAKLKKHSAGSNLLRLQLTLQACDAGHCLAPETRLLNLLIK